MPSTLFGHSCGHPEGGALQRMDVSRYKKVCEPVHRCKILRCNNVCFKMHTEMYLTDKILVINSSVQSFVVHLHKDGQWGRVMSCYGTEF